MEIWKNSESVDLTEYPLQCRNAVYTERALRAYLRIESSKNPGEKWTDKELREASELAGVCAFRTPGSCIAWGETAAYPDTRYVAFEGEELTSTIEDDSVIARVVQASGDLMTLQEFKATFMRTTHISNRNGTSCILACFESFLQRNGVHRTQEEMIDANRDLWVIRQNGRIFEGTVPVGLEGVFFKREGVSYQRIGPFADADKFDRIHDATHGLDLKEGFIIGITHHVDELHAVLFDSVDCNSEIWVMDPNSGYQNLNRDYPEIAEVTLHRISIPPDKP